MIELELVGIHSDGEHLVLEGPDGQRHRLVIDDALRAAVRRDRPGLEQIRSGGGARPRDIQVLIRAGASAEEVADAAGVAVDQVRRYEGPVVAERQHVAQRARAITIGRDPGAPTLGDLVIDRLAARGVSGVEWDARRRGSDPWEVIARFNAGERDREAIWHVDLSGGILTALDDESRWLSETDLAPQRRHLSAVRGARLYDIESDADIAPTLAAVDAVIRDTRPRAVEPVDEEPDAVEESESSGDVEAILDELTAARGVRQRVEIDDDALALEVAAQDEERDPEPAAPHTPTLWDELPGAHPAPSHPEEAPDSTVLEMPEQPASRKGRHTRRTSVPSWDEIVFGAKSDS